MPQEWFEQITFPALDFLDVLKQQVRDQLSVEDWKIECAAMIHAFFELDESGRFFLGRGNS